MRFLPGSLDDTISTDSGFYNQREDISHSGMTERTQQLMKQSEPRKSYYNFKTMTSKGDKDDNEYRWAVEFSAGPGGFIEKAEIFSTWFKTFDDAKEDAFSRAETEMVAYPFSRGKILKLIIEDKNGKITVLQDVSEEVPFR